MTDAQIEARIDQDTAHITAIVRRYGWYIQYVCGSTLKESRRPAHPFAYTVGLFGMHHPELLILGVPPRWRPASSTCSATGSRPART
jgi:hypothetical protein